MSNMSKDYSAKGLSQRILLVRDMLGPELVAVSGRERWVSAMGGGLAILLLAGICRSLIPGGGASILTASMGATAVLLFAVPHGPLSQPWPVIGGHGLSALIGVICAQCIHNPSLASAAAVALSIAGMHQFRCIHPPGGGTALAAVIGGEAVRSLGFSYIFFPVLANATVMVLLAVLVNLPFQWRRYPAVFSRFSLIPQSTTSREAAKPTHEEVLQAIRSLDSFVDISEADLIRLVEVLSCPKERRE